jgi:hypothetical protein
MFATAAVTVPAATALAVGGGSAKAVGIGVVIGFGGLVCLWVWWRLRPRPRGVAAARRVVAGAGLALVGTALVEGGLVLFLVQSPDDPPSAFMPALAVGGAGVLCVVARIAVGVRAVAARRPRTARR